MNESTGVLSSPCMCGRDESGCPCPADSGCPGLHSIVFWRWSRRELKWFSVGHPFPHPSSRSCRHRRVILGFLFLAAELWTLVWKQKQKENCQHIEYYTTLATRQKFQRKQVGPLTTEFLQLRPEKKESSTYALKREQKFRAGKITGIAQKHSTFSSLRISPATSSIYVLYMRPLQPSLKDSISYIYFLSNNVL
jgi:hypothetical protein